MRQRKLMIRKIRSVFQNTLLSAAFVLCALMVNGNIFGQEQVEVVEITYDIEGVVRDAKTKTPIAAAQIQTLNSKFSATSNENGEFVIEVEDLTDVLQVVAFDYNLIEVSVRGRRDLVIDLYSDVFEELYPDLDGITGIVKSSYTTDGISQINDFSRNTSFSVNQNLQTRLGGEVRSIMQSGAIGAGSSMFIRGNNSLNITAQPLIVVDGVIWDRFNEVFSLHNGYISNPLVDVVPSDVENISVIKDGTSLWGAKGGNGVILITTKRAKDMATKIVLNATTGFLESPSSLPVMDGDQYRLYTTDLLAGMDKDVILSRFGATVDNFGYLNDNPLQRSYGKYHNTTDWDKEVYRTGFYQDYDIGVTGGDDKALYAFSVGYSSSDDVVSEVDLQRFNARFNADINLYENIDLGLNIGYTNSDRELVDDGVSVFSSPSYLAMIKAPFLSPYSYSQLGEITDDIASADFFGVSNPKGVISAKNNRNKHYRFNVGLKPVFRIGEHFVFSNRFDYNLTKEEEAYYLPEKYVSVRMLEGYGEVQSQANNQQMRNVGIFNDARLKYNNRFAKYHRVEAVLGWRYMSDKLELDFGEGYNSGSLNVNYLTKDLYYRRVYGINSNSKSISNYFNVDYSYDNRYFLSATASVDGSSAFGRETQGGFQLFDRSWAVFPSLRLAWLASSEKFMKNVTFVDRLKLRAGVSLSGNDDIPPYDQSAYFTSVKYMNRANGLVLTNVGNEEIQWETSTKMNVGVDINMLNNRLALAADFYHNSVDDLLSYRPFPEVAGTGKYWTNGGEMTNIGFDLSANVKLLNTQKLKWDVGANLGHYKNEVTDLPDGSFTTDVYDVKVLTTVGQAAGVFYGYKTDGVYATSAQAQADNLYIVDDLGEKRYFGAGDMKFREAVADGVIDEKDMTIIGNPNPDFFGAFNTNLSFYNFTLSALFTFSYGNDAYNYMRASLESGSDFYNQTTAMLGRWTYEGQQTMMPKIMYGDPMGNARFSDRWIEDASYLKLKKLSLSYDVPIGHPMIDALQIWVAANNLFTWTDYLGNDPEFSIDGRVLYQGIDMGFLPNSPSYFIGVKINL